VSTAAQIASDIRSSSSYATEAIVYRLCELGYSKTGYPNREAIRLDIQTHEGEFTPDHVAEYLHSLGYSKGPRMTRDEVRKAFQRGTQRWHDDSTPKDSLEVYWAEELGVKVVPGTRIPGGV
jgi:hypothetical protein